MLSHKKAAESVTGFEGADRITNAELLCLKCDILVPAALENAIGSANAASVRARLIVEGANGPVTAEADAIICDQGKFIIPDIIANAGGVIVSYFEWVQDRQCFFWSEDEVNSRLEKMLCIAFDEALEMSQREKLDMRQAAYGLAMKRIAESMESRGIFP